MTRLKGIFLTPDGFRYGSLTMAQGLITALEGDSISESEARCLGEPIFVPGFIDLHVHGGDGSCFMDGGSSADRIAKYHARHGTTALLATTVATTPRRMLAALRGIVPHIQQRKQGAGRILGIHYESVHTSPTQLGTDFNRVSTPKSLAIGNFHVIAPIRVITLAPEIQGNQALIPRLAGLGVRIQIGHSAASYEEGCLAIANGAHGFTHLFSTANNLDHQKPGLISVALGHACHAELIPDLRHVHPGAIHAALRAIPELYCVSHYSPATGDTSCQYKAQSGSCDERGQKDSILTMDQALRNLTSIGVTLQDACRRVSAIPANYLGLAGRGRLQPGAVADLAAFDSDLNLVQVFAEGEDIDLSDDSGFGTK